jgi:hypothetical protein
MAWFFWLCGRVFQIVSIITGGTVLLGVLGTWARIPLGFLELGSRTGCSYLAGWIVGLGNVGQFIGIGKIAARQQGRDNHIDRN